MQTKLSQYCEGLIEAGWLVAVITTPLFFNVFSSRIFEPDKIALLRSLALFILAAWLIKLLDESKNSIEGQKGGGNRWFGIFRIPLLAPIISLGVIYLISTFFSINPRISFWGSYQRLQGTYTTLSYLVIFFAILGNLRRRDQVERIISTIVLTSLPVALYGVLQRYKLDPIPWGGDVSTRIASSLGNSIFVAAYLIMAFPLTIGRIVRDFREILLDSDLIALKMARASIYLFIAAMQVVALYLSGSRGPALGWMAGTFFIFVLLSVYWRKRWATFSMIGIAFALGVFLLIFNIEKGPFESLRTSQAIGRFGLLLNAESNSALVRRYIWEGAAELVSIHPPLEFPDGSKDRFNFLRPLLGYGPESMYVAYNPFYIPALGQVERRNASPDRSHNETWDSVVITGILGLAAYLYLFSAIFYFGLKWMGLIKSRKQKNAFLVCYFSAGFIGGVGFGVWRGVEYLGVGIPFGLFVGLIAYIVIFVTFFPKIELPKNESEVARFITILVFLAAVVSHFVEINFGISIAVTRLYFWVYTSLLLMVGVILPGIKEYHIENEDYSLFTKNIFLQQEDEMMDGLIDLQRVKRKPVIGKSTRGRTTYPKAESIKLVYFVEILFGGFILSVILITLGYDLITNAQANQTFVQVLRQSLLVIKSGSAISYGIVLLILTTWIFGSILLTGEIASITGFKQEKSGTPRYFAALLIISGSSILIGLVFWFIQASSLALIARIQPANIDQLLAQLARYGGLLTNYYLFLFGLMLIAGIYLGARRRKVVEKFKLRGLSAIPFVLIGVVVIANLSNLRIIQADINFKLAGGFNRSGSWPVAISIYQDANKIAPNEDYYYLFLGRAYLEQARSLSNPVEQDALFEQAKDDLLVAQRLNPLNPDHTANLARLYSMWSAIFNDDPTKRQLAKISDEYFSRAVVLSPNNVRLWNEWAYLQLNQLDQREKAFTTLEKALEVDPSYDWTYGLLGDYYSGLAEMEVNPQARQSLLNQAIDNYQKNLGLPGDGQIKSNYAIKLGVIAEQTGQLRDAVENYLMALDLSPDNPGAWRIEEGLSQLYLKLEDRVKAIFHAQNAINLAPADQKERLQLIIEQIK